MAEDRVADAGGRVFGHPRQLWMLLGVTVGVNLGFYGFRAFLAPYLAQDFFAALGAAAAQRQADLLASGFFALMYATPIVGGYVADKLLGETRALALSMWLGVAALVAMAAPTLAGFEAGLALFALATGLGIPLTVLIGRNYATADPRRDAGYTLYYLAINVGSFVAPLVCADLVGRRFGYRAGFLAAAAGLALAAALFQWRKRRLDPVVPGGGHRGGAHAGRWVVLAIAALVWPTALLLGHPGLLRTAMYVLMALLVAYFVASGVRRRDRVQAQRYLALFALFVALVVFWALSLQGVTSLNFLARDYVDAPWDYTVFQSANPLFILVLAPFLALLWPWLEKRHRDPSTPAKFALSLMLVAASYGVLVYAIDHATGVDGRLAWWPLALCYLLQTLGELALSPIGYALVGQLAAPEEASLAMGGWFFGVAVAYQVAGWIATLTANAAATGGIADYAQVYARVAIGGLAVALAFALATPGVRRLMHGVH